MLPFLDAFKRLATTRGRPIKELIQKDPETGKVVKVKALVLSLNFVGACAVEIHGIDYSTNEARLEALRGPWVFGVVIGPANQAFTTLRSERIPLTFNRHADTSAVLITDEEFADLQKLHDQSVQKAHEEAHGTPKTSVV